MGEALRYSLMALCTRAISQMGRRMVGVEG